jgi:hypothetical protein
MLKMWYNQLYWIPLIVVSYNITRIAVICVITALTFIYRKIPVLDDKLLENSSRVPPDLAPSKAFELALVRMIYHVKGKNMRTRHAFIG